MPVDLFQFINNLFSKKETVTSRTEFKETYMTIRFLSLYPKTFFLAKKANELSSKIPNWATNLFLFHTIKKQDPPWIKYPKGAESQKQWPKEAIDKIMKKLCCSQEHAIQTLNILSSKDSDLLESLGIGKEGKERGKKKNIRTSKSKKSK